MPVTAVIGAQWGDEGKGKLVDLLSGEADLVCRYNGGANAGHTIVANNKTYKLNLLPSGIVHEKTINVIGNGVVCDLEHLFKELSQIDVCTKGRLLISDRAHILFKFHQLIDGLQEVSLGKEAIGTTKKGIGPCYAGKADRVNLRMCDLKNWQVFEENLRNLITRVRKRYNFKEIQEYDVEAELEKYKGIREKVLPMLADTVVYVNKAINSGKNVLVEGANAVMLDLDFGTYPFVTSSNPSIGGACTGLGIPPGKIGKVYGVIKAYCTRVGAGRFPTELEDEIGDKMRNVGHEFGTTTGRARRCGWMDIPAIKYSHLINNYSSLCLTKLDVLTGIKELKLGTTYKLDDQVIDCVPASLDELARVKVEYESLPGWDEDISGARKFEDLPKNAQDYVKRAEQLLGIPIEYIGVGPSREAIIHLPLKN